MALRAENWVSFIQIISEQLRSLRTEALECSDFWVWTRVSSSGSSRWLTSQWSWSGSGEEGVHDVMRWKSLKEWSAVSDTAKSRARLRSDSLCVTRWRSWVSPTEHFPRDTGHKDQQMSAQEIFESKYSSICRTPNRNALVSLGIRFHSCS